MRTLRSLLLISVSAAAMCVPMLAAADSNFGTTGSAAANLDFQVVIADYVYFQVGSPTTGNVNLVTFPVDGATNAPVRGPRLPVTRT